MDHKGDDQKAEYRRRAVEQVMIGCPGMLRDLACLVVDYALNRHFCPLAELSLRIGDRVDVRLDDQKNRGMKGEWMRGQIRSLPEGMKMQYTLDRWSSSWRDSVPIREDRVQPAGWFTDPIPSGSWPVGQPVWVWDRVIQQWVPGTVRDAKWPGSQWEVTLHRPAFQMIPARPSLKHPEKKPVLRKQALPSPVPTVFCAGEIHIRIDSTPPSQPLHPEDGAVKLIGREIEK